MKFLIIVLCLLSERYLQHVLSYKRFQWFDAYARHIETGLSKFSFLASTWVALTAMVLPILMIAQLCLLIFASLFHGIPGFFFHLLIFYYCLGPDNPFYPQRKTQTESNNQHEVGDYLSQVNGQLFAVIFWYIVLGPVGVLAYRLMSLAQTQRLASHAARIMTELFDWIPARMTAFLYLLVGNFKHGFAHYSHLFFSKLQKNKLLLSHCGIHALSPVEEPAALLPEAESLVEHSLILFLALFALFILCAVIK